MKSLVSNRYKVVIFFYKFHFSSCIDTDDIRIEEMTKGITEEIQSEIGKVKNKVDDDLENSELFGLKTVTDNISGYK